MEIKYTQEPNPLACGQAVLSMITGIPVRKVCDSLGTEKETDLKQMKNFLAGKGFSMGERKAATEKKDLPDLCVLSLETPRCWHWSLYFKGVFFDPEHGVLLDWPTSRRKYYFEVKVDFRG